MLNSICPLFDARYFLLILWFLISVNNFRSHELYWQVAQLFAVCFIVQWLVAKEHFLSATFCKTISFCHCLCLYWGVGNEHITPGKWIISMIDIEMINAEIATKTLVILLNLGQKRWQKLQVNRRLSFILLLRRN